MSNQHLPLIFRTSRPTSNNLKQIYTVDGTFTFKLLILQTLIENSTGMQA